jgi:hypothetical protein
MSAIKTLHDEYPGDEKWQEFVDVFRRDWSEMKERDLYIQELGDEEVAIVLTSAMGEKSVRWFSQPCGALEKRSPVDVFKNEKSGLLIIRSLLMRMPR